MERMLMKNYLSQFIIVATTLLFFPSLSAPQWVRTNGPYGGSISTFVISGKNLYAGTWSGVFVTSDSGANWIPVGLKNDWVSALATYSNPEVIQFFWPELFSTMALSFVPQTTETIGQNRIAESKIFLSTLLQSRIQQSLLVHTFGAYIDLPTMARTGTETAAGFHQILYMRF